MLKRRPSYDDALSNTVDDFGNELETLSAGRENCRAPSCQKWLECCISLIFVREMYISMFIMFYYLRKKRYN